MGKDKKSIKARHWAIIVYPESAPTDWQDIIQSTGCQCAVSPLHDKDVNESTGEVKKAHYHVVVSYGNTTTYNNVKSLSDSLNAPIPQKINSVKGAVRYFTHMDNPEKHQYDPNDIKCINGFDLEEYTKLTLTQLYDIKYDIIQYMEDNQIVLYHVLLMKLHELNYDWYKVAADNTIFFNSVCNSLYRKLKHQYTNSDHSRAILDHIKSESDVNSQVEDETP